MRHIRLAMFALLVAVFLPIPQSSAQQATAPPPSTMSGSSSAPATGAASGVASKSVGPTGTRITTNQKEMVSPADEYIIGEQDVLAITVWKERELSGTVVVRPDGKITLPLVDDISVVGLTTAQLRALLIERLKPFVAVPQVTVAVSQINSRKVYLIGEVAKTGMFAINSSTTVLQLLAEAGGMSNFAKRKDIYVLRNQQGKQVKYRFNYDEVVRGKNNQQNILLEPGDTVVVP